MGWVEVRHNPVRLGIDVCLGWRLVLRWHPLSGLRVAGLPVGQVLGCPARLAVDLVGQAAGAMLGWPTGLAADLAGYVAGYVVGNVVGNVVG